MSRRGFAPLLAILASCAAGCATTAQYGALASAGSAYATAVEQLLIVDAELHVDASSERLLQNDVLANLTESQYDGVAEDDRRLVRTLADLRDHVRLTRRYFVGLGELGADRTATRVDDSLAGIAMELRRLGTALEDSPLLDASGRKALGALGTVSVAAGIRGALARELRARGDTIRRELALQQALLESLGDAIEANLTIVAQAREHRLVRAPLLAEKPISNADRWITRRRDVLMAEATAGELTAAAEAAASLQQAFEALMKGRLTAERLEVTGLELQALLEVATRVVERHR